MCCLGDADRHEWVNMNSSLGTGKPANVITECIPGPMNDSFLVFKAAADIKAMEGELLWDFQWKKGTGEAQPKVAEPASDGAAAAAASAAAPAAASAAASAASAAAAAAPAASAASAAAAAAPAASAAAAAAPSAPPPAFGPERLEADSSASAPQAEDNFLGDNEEEGGNAAGALQEEDDGEELTAEKVCAFWTSLVALQDISAHAYFYRTGLHVVFEEPSKMLPKHSIIADIDGGSILKDQAWTAVPYSPNAKTIIYANDEFGPMHEFCGKMVQSVWDCSFVVTGKGLGVAVAPQKSQGKVVDLFWTPPVEVDKKVVEGLLALEDMEVIFNFSCLQEDSGMQLAPDGLIIRTKEDLEKVKDHVAVRVPCEDRALVKSG
jgi:hypothetical protein